MKYNEQDELLKKIAASYAETYGSELKKQLGEAESLDTEQLDIKLRRKMKRRYRSIYGVCALAACLILVFTLPRVFLSGGSSMAPPNAAQPAAPPQSQFEIVPLSFELPEGFSVDGRDQDREKTIYYLDNTAMDDVVLTAELSAGFIETTGLTELDINSTRAYASSKQGANILIFEKDGVLYTLSCRYDINTLIGLGRAIL